MISTTVRSPAVSGALALLACSLLAACSGKKAPEAAATIAPAAQKAATATAVVYTGGDILTMAGSEPQYAEALVVQDGKIAYVGAKGGAAAAAGADATTVDLGGRTLLPGFIDAHSHLLTYADSLVQANLAPAPIGGVASIADIVTQLRTLKADLKADDGEWLIGQGYDQDMLAEKRHPTAADLDAAFPANPVVLMHASGHMLVANSAALKAAGIDANTSDPEGGAIIRKPGTQEPEGLVQEMAMYAFLPFTKVQRAPEVDLELLQRAVQHYASYGVTTAAEHLVMEEKMPLLELAADKGVLTLDVVATPAFLVAPKLIGTGAVKWGEYRGGLKYVGIKLALDGSPQGKTAYLTQPYQTPVPGCSKDCRGFANMTQDDVNSLFLLAYRNKVQLYAHCNGDAAIDMMIRAHRFAEQQLGETSRDRRTVIIHSQVMRPDQMTAYRELGLLPSFFTNHVYYWGDTHLANLGEKRAAYISPLKSALTAGIRATNHTDCTVTPIDPLFLLWTSVNRVTRSGRVLGAAERATPYQGLLALTANGAYEYFEEGSKGTLEAGKRADLVILDRNPLKVEPMAIRDIKVVETIKDGRTVFKSTP